MNKDTLALLLRIAGGAATSILPGAVGVAVGAAVKAVDVVEGALADEARLRGIPPEQLREQLIAELDQAFPTVKSNIEERIRRIEGGPDA